MSQMRPSPSELQTARRVPSGLNTSDVTACKTETKGAKGVPVCASQKPSWPLWSPAASVVPSGLTATRRTQPVMRIGDPIGSKVAPFQSLSKPSRDPVTSTVPAELNPSSKAVAGACPCCLAIKRVVKASQSRIMPSAACRGDHLAVGTGGQSGDLRRMIHRLADARAVAESPDSGRSFIASCENRRPSPLKTTARTDLVCGRGSPCRSF